MAVLPQNDIKLKKKIVAVREKVRSIRQKFLKYQVFATQIR